MKVERIELRKFRSIEKCIVYPQDIWCLVGENNSGKSAILRALNSFFNFNEEKKEFLEGSHQYT
ncbi:AAA family ATPase [Salinibacter ruber]|jgi:predicted ATP-dependent endonuclease of OLD family|uniref:AAA family ATPase n=1 Tax=Salinibacter ruber TaxID=146919 RepID=UPI001613856C|nr:putative ATP-dependent endonuclease of OLD family [Salinibacter ruber]MCS4188951.1 putative ATP-dependent endonuclease of OLD family [Salinibacter ruber]